MPLPTAPPAPTTPTTATTPTTETSAIADHARSAGGVGPAAVTRRASASSADTQPAEHVHLRDRYRLIADIRRFNPTAEESFLCQFDAEQLGDYLDHLRLARHKHVRLSGWVQRRAARLEAARDALSRSRRTLRQAG